MIARRRFLLLGAAVLGSVPATGLAAKSWRVGILSPGGVPDPDVETVPNLVPRLLAEIGYREGADLAIDRRFAGGRAEALRGLARELVGSEPDVVVTAGAEATQAAREATRRVPIVMVTSIDPVKAGWVERLSRPGGYVTGVMTVAASVMAAKRLQLLREVVPSVRRVALLSDGGPAAGVQVAEAQNAAKQMGLHLVTVNVRHRDYRNAFEAMRTQRAEALLVLLSPILTGDHRAIIDLAASHRLPAVFDWRQHAQMGGLIAYGGDFVEICRRVATQVDRILRGHPVGEIPVEQATTFKLAVNLAAARALGLALPQSVLMRADHVYG